MDAARKALAIFKGPNVFMWKLLRLSVGQTDGRVTRFRRSPLFLDGAISGYLLRGARPICLQHTATKRSEEHTSELQPLMRISYAVLCLKKKKYHDTAYDITSHRT